MLCSLLLYNKVNQLYVCIYPLPPGPPSHPTPPFHPSGSSQSTKLSSLCYSMFPLAFCSTHGSVYPSILFSQLVLPSLSRIMPTCPFSLMTLTTAFFSLRFLLYKEDWGVMCTRSEAECLEAKPPANSATLGKVNKLLKFYFLISKRDGLPMICVS